MDLYNKDINMIIDENAYNNLEFNVYLFILKDFFKFPWRSLNFKQRSINI
jgi:hypothetical protein